MKPIAIFRHLACEGPGYFAEFLQKHQLEFTLIRIDQGEVVPNSTDTYSALVFMGGPMSVNDDLPWINKELELIRQATQKNMPVLGHCLGGQLICKALGGEVTANQVKEIGWHHVQTLKNTASDKWLNKLPNEFEAFHWHGETFSIPEGANPILKSEYCDHQAFVMQNTLALQCHVEMTADLVSEWSREYADELATTTESVQSAEMINSDLTQRIIKLNQIADEFYLQWIKPLATG